MQTIICEDIAELSELRRDLLVAQYEKLREEQQMRIDKRQEIMIFTLILSGTFFSLSLQGWISGVSVLCYPILALFLAAAWQKHNTRIGDIAKILRVIEEKYLGDDSYEKQLAQMHPKQPMSKYPFTLASLKMLLQEKQELKELAISASKVSLVSLQAKGVFCTSQCMGLAIGVSRIWDTMHSISWLVVVFVIVDVLALIATFWMLQHKRER